MTTHIINDNKNETKYERRIFNILHSCADNPAIIITNNYNITKKWYQFGKLHRDNDLPAIEISGYNSNYDFINDNLNDINDHNHDNDNFNNHNINNVINNYNKNMPIIWQEWFHKGIPSRKTIDNDGNVFPAVIGPGYKKWIQDGIILDIKCESDDPNMINDIKDQLKPKHITQYSCHEQCIPYYNSEHHAQYILDELYDSEDTLSWTRNWISIWK